MAHQSPSDVLVRGGHIRPGSLDWEEMNRELPAGPLDVAELYNWPDRALRVLRLRSSEAVDALSRNLETGISLISHYSGKGTAESAFADVADFMRRTENARIPKICAQSACDLSPLCRELLLRHDTQSRPKHVFGDILQRIPMQSPPLSDLAATDVQRFLEAHLSELYNPQAKAFCFKHMQPCCLWDGLDSPQKPSARSGLLVSAAGFSCVDWSPRRTGKKPRLEGKSAPCFWHWVAENKALRPDLLMWENSSHFQPSVLEEGLGDEYVHMSFRVCPTMIGWPQTRPRYFGLAVLRETCHFGGSGEEFLCWFRQRVELDADDLLQASPAEVHSMMYERAIKRGHVVARDTMPPLSMAVAPSGMVHLESYAKLRPLKSSLTGCFLADLDQGPSFASSGSFMPSCATHSSIYSFAKARLCTGKEMLSCMGALANN